MLVSIRLTYYSLQPSVEVPTWMHDIPVVPDAVQDLLECILNRDSETLEVLLMEHGDNVNHHVGLPFELSNGRFANHEALSQMTLMQHPRQTLLDIASAMPDGPVIWVLLSYGARGSTHPLGYDLAMHNAIGNGRQYTVQALSIPGRSNINGLPDSSWRPLLQAVLWSGPEIVNILLKRRARVNEVGTSSVSPGMYTALQLCLERRSSEYQNESLRSKCNENLKLLLNAGASLHTLPPEGPTATPFEKFLEPWRSCDHWTMDVSSLELECLGSFVEMGADLSTKFLGYPCAASSSNTFAHQALWHSPLRILRRTISSYCQDYPNSGVLLLHELLGKCADANRHCAGALEDIETLLGRGVNPNALDDFGMAPLRKCVEHAPTVDVLAMTQKLLDGGADPEYEDVDGMQPYSLAALTLPEPVRSEVLQAMLAKMQGRGTVTKNDMTYGWEAGLFPIPDDPSYQQVLSCTMREGAFRLSMQEMVHIDVQQSFRRAYLAVLSGRLLGNIAKRAATCKVSEKDRWNVMLTLSLRKGANLPNYQFDQGLVIALLGFPNIDINKLDAVHNAPRSSKEDNIDESDQRSDPPALGTTSIFRPFQLNTRHPTSSLSSPEAPTESQNLSVTNDSFVGDTTQLRWRNPESSKAPKPTASFVLQYKCSTCADDRLLTMAELQTHGIEHAHSAECDGVGCTRRFCNETRKRKRNEKGCQDHLFSDTIY
jgi:ankyrin repeat protein